jgi:hypothetical protein
MDGMMDTFGGVAWLDSGGMAWRGSICMEFCGIVKRNRNKWDMGWRLAFLCAQSPRILGVLLVMVIDTCFASALRVNGEILLLLQNVPLGVELRQRVDEFLSLFSQNFPRFSLPLHSNIIVFFGLVP